MDRTVESMKSLCVQENPSGDEEHLSSNKAKASEEAGDATTPSLCPGLLSDQFLLKLCYRLDVPLGRRSDRGCDDTAILSSWGFK